MVRLFSLILPKDDVLAFMNGTTIEFNSDKIISGMSTLDQSMLNGIKIIKKNDELRSIEYRSCAITLFFISYCGVRELLKR